MDNEEVWIYCWFDSFMFPLGVLFDNIGHYDEFFTLCTIWHMGANSVLVFAYDCTCVTLWFQIIYLLCMMIFANVDALCYTVIPIFNTFYIPRYWHALMLYVIFLFWHLMLIMYSDISMCLCLMLYCYFSLFTYYI